MLGHATDGTHGLPEFIVLVLVLVLVLGKFERLGKLSIGALRPEVISKMPGKYVFEHEDDLAAVGCFLSSSGGPGRP
jgi:hypothetical protein